MAADLLDSSPVSASPGDRLPTVDRLAETFAVSRAVVREAVARLGAKGLVEVRHGDGIYVGAPRIADVAEALRILVHFTTRDSRTLFLDVMEFRRVIEAEATRLAADRATAEDLARISDALDRGRKAHAASDRTQVNSADVDFHDAVVQASHNSLFMLMMAVVQPLMQELRSMYPSTRAKSASNDHDHILGAILNRTPAAAANRASAHVEHVNGELSHIIFDIDTTNDHHQEIKTDDAREDGAA